MNIPSTPSLFLRRAVPNDIDTIFRWRAETVEWLARRHPGTDQWQPPYPRANLERWVERGETFMASLHPTGPAVATVTSSSEGDPDLWTPDELATPARYVSKLNVDRRLRGFGFGSTLMDWARAAAAAAGVETVRIDVWSTNLELQALYLQWGFQYLRTVPDTNSGALFEIPAGGVGDVAVVELFAPFGNCHGQVAV